MMVTDLQITTTGTALVILVIFSMSMVVQGHGSPYFPAASARSSLSLKYQSVRTLLENLHVSLAVSRLFTSCDITNVSASSSGLSLATHTHTWHSLLLFIGQVNNHPSLFMLQLTISLIYISIILSVMFLIKAQNKAVIVTVLSSKHTGTHTPQ